LADLINARNDPLTALMQRLLAKFAFSERRSRNDAAFTDAIYTTRLQMSSQNVGQIVKIEVLSAKNWFPQA